MLPLGRSLLALLLLLLHLLQPFEGCSASRGRPASSEGGGRPSRLLSRAQPSRTAQASPGHLAQSLAPHSRKLNAGPIECPNLSKGGIFSSPIPDQVQDTDNIGDCMRGTSDVQEAANTCQLNFACIGVIVDFTANNRCLKSNVEQLRNKSNPNGGRSACLYVRKSCPSLLPELGFGSPTTNVDSPKNDMKCYHGNGLIESGKRAFECRDDPTCVAFLIGYFWKHICLKHTLNATLEVLDPGANGQPASCLYEKVQAEPPRPPVEPSPPPPDLNTWALYGGLSAALLVLVLGACALIFFRHKLRALFGTGESKGRAGADGYRFSVQEIIETTGSFSQDNFLGHGGFGEVYYGKLAPSHPRYPGQQVAVKKQLKTKSKLADVDFFWEAQILATVRHRNVVELLGFCEGRGERYLVYEFVERGSLYKILKHQEPAMRESNNAAQRPGFLLSKGTGTGGASSNTFGDGSAMTAGDKHAGAVGELSHCAVTVSQHSGCAVTVSQRSGGAGGGAGEKEPPSLPQKEVPEPLRWESRIRIAAGAARGLKYLHYELKQEILHLDIKSDNILVDAQFRAKVADFGISKMREEASDEAPADANEALRVGNSECGSAPQGRETESSSNKFGTSVAPESSSTGGAAPATLATGRLHGTRGYLDPSFFTTSRLTRGSDVYSFGIVLLELATGCFPLGLELDSYPVSLPQLVLRTVNSQGFAAACAPSILESWSEEASSSPFAVELVSGVLTHQHPHSLHEDAEEPETIEGKLERGSAGAESGVGGASRGRSNRSTGSTGSTGAAGSLDPAVFKRFLCLAMWCCVHERDLRPSMDQVFTALQEIEQGKWRCRRDLGEGQVLDAGGKLKERLFPG